MSLFKMKQLCIVLLLAISQIAFSSEQNIIVETGNGKIEGLIVTLESGFKIDNFLGIKYGTIPERFTVRNKFLLNYSKPWAHRTLIFILEVVTYQAMEGCIRSKNCTTSLHAVIDLRGSANFADRHRRLSLFECICPPRKSNFN